MKWNYYNKLIILPVITNHWKWKWLKEKLHFDHNYKSVWQLELSRFLIICCITHQYFNLGIDDQHSVDKTTGTINLF